MKIGKLKGVHFLWLALSFHCFVALLFAGMAYYFHRHAVVFSAEQTDRAAKTAAVRANIAHATDISKLRASALLNFDNAIQSDETIAAFAHTADIALWNLCTIPLASLFLIGAALFRLNRETLAGRG